MAASPDAQTASMIANLASTTGKSLEQWVALARASGMRKHGTLVKWLKDTHGVTHGYANLIAHGTFKSDASSMAAAGDDLVAEMFAGDKAALRPIFDAGSWNAMVPHRVRIESAAQVDRELIGWLRQAYDGAQAGTVQR